VTVAGKAVLITGAGRGIGAALARELAGRGARISIVGLEPDRLEALAAELGEAHVAFEADVTDPAALEAAVAGTLERLGGIDAVVANAGISGYGTVATMDPDVFARTIEINLIGSYRTVHATLDEIRARRGYILVVASLSSFVPLAGMSAYTASKAGVEAFANALRMEVSHVGVGVGTAHPAWIDTDLVRDAEADLEAFSDNRGGMPGFLWATMPVEECARQLADGIERRAGRICVPRTAVVAHWLRSVLGGPLAARLLRRRTAEVVPRLEADLARLGRSVSERTEATDTVL
jgi:NAD(P)-dependent dehydrogenase (short-subunit alcohol dehydrogenase family)